MKPEKRREQILRAATSVFAAKGYHRASVTDIIDGANIARGTFYLYFDGKREIFAELVDVLTLRLINCMKLVDLSPDSPPWIEQIRANILRIAIILVDDRELTQILYNHAMGLDEEFDKKIREFYEEMSKRTASAFRLGQELGLIRSDVNVELVALHVVGAVKEVMYHLARQGDENVSTEAVVDEAMSYYVRGVLVSTPAKTTRPKKTSRKKKS